MAPAAEMRKHRQLTLALTWQLRGLLQQQEKQRGTVRIPCPAAARAAIRRSRNAPAPETHPLQKPTRLLEAAPMGPRGTERPSPRRTPRGWRREGSAAVAPQCVHTAADSAALWPPRCRDEAEDELARLQAELQESVYEQAARPRSTALYGGCRVRIGSG